MKESLKCDSNHEGNRPPCNWGRQIIVAVLRRGRQDATGFETASDLGRKDSGREITMSLYGCRRWRNFDCGGRLSFGIRRIAAE